MIVHPSSRLGIELGTRYQYNRDNTQWIANVGEIGADTTHYLFGRLHQDLLSFTGRMDLTIRPTLSLQLYAEPFVTAGHFTDVRELQKQVKAAGASLMVEADEASTGPASFIVVDPDGNPVLFDQHR
mgnify:CR=1 FL=1